jgi:ribose transport system substrate-binding protein
MKKRHLKRLSRRQFLRLTAGSSTAALLMAYGGLALGQEATPEATEEVIRDIIAEATIRAEGAEIDVAQYAKEGPYRIGFSNGFSGNSWRAMMLEYLEREAEKFPEIEELIIVDGQNDINKQVNDIESLIAQNVDVILTIPNSGTAVAPVLRRATREGIVTIPFNLPVDGEEYTAYLGTDPANKGTRLGEWLRDALGGEGSIVALGGLPGNSYTAAAWEAAQAVFAETDIEVLAFRDAYWEEDRAKVVMADLITAYPQIDGIWCDGAQVAAGACKALLDANRPLVPVTGDDYNGLLKLYAENAADHPNFSFGLIAEPTWESALALRTAINILQGVPTTQLQIIEPPFITVENYEDFLKPDLPDGVFAYNDLPDEVLEEIFSGA